MNKRTIIYYIIVIAVLGIFVFPMSYDVYISFSSPTMNDIKLKCAKKNLGIIIIFMKERKIPIQQKFLKHIKE